MSILAGSNHKSVGRMQGSALSHQKIRTQVLLYVPGISSEPFIRFFRHSWSTCEVSDAIQVTGHILVLLAKSVK